MAVILASSCLLGCECRYKGDGCKCDALIKLAENNTIIGVCPEQMGGLPTPRPPAEICGQAAENFPAHGDHPVPAAKLLRQGMALALPVVPAGHPQQARADQYRHRTSSLPFRQA